MEYLIFILGLSYNREDEEEEIAGITGPDGQPVNASAAPSKESTTLAPEPTGSKDAVEAKEVREV